MNFDRIPFAVGEGLGHPALDELGRLPAAVFPAQPDVLASPKSHGGERSFQVLLCFRAFEGSLLHFSQPGCVDGGFVKANGRGEDANDAVLERNPAFVKSR
jgi:hypothetical protein